MEHNEKQTNTSSLSDLQDPAVENNNTNPLSGTGPLDPSSPDFSIRAWLSSSSPFSRNNNQSPHLGVSFRNLSVSGFGSPTDYQKTVANIPLQLLTSLTRFLSGSHPRREISILHAFDGVVAPGEMLLVLGRPGSGCSTLLKTLSCDTHGLSISESSRLNYSGLSPAEIRQGFRGEAIYMAEHDVHFPQLTVDETLGFAAAARASDTSTSGVGTAREEYVKKVVEVAKATFGLSAVGGTNVGSDLVKGISGGERKRVSIAEVMLAGSALQCWDNSTRGLDSANAIEFCRTLGVYAELAGRTAVVALYQAPEAAYECFDKLTVLYGGRQIYFGEAEKAAGYFEGLGFERAERQTTSDFLTSVTSSERRVRSGWENKVPRTPEEFVARWKESEAYKRLVGEMERFEDAHPLGEGKGRRQSPYLISYPQQIALCVKRGFQRLRRDASVTITGIIANSFLALVIGSAFYNLSPTTDSIFGRGVVIFLSVTLSAFASALEITIMYHQRPIVEKQIRYAFHHPSAEAFAGLVTDLPYKIGNAIFFNLVLYFMTNLRREPAAFFIFFLFSFATTLAGSHIFRTIGVMTHNVYEAIVPAAVVAQAMIMYAGYAVPPTYMVPWFGWIRHVNPISYAFEALMINEFAGRDFPCAGEQFVPRGPGYEDADPLSRTCAVVGAQAGDGVVSGDAFLRETFGYEPDHLWRNFGVLMALVLFYLGTYILLAEFIPAYKPKGEVLVFRRGHGLRPEDVGPEDVESSRTTALTVSEPPGMSSIQRHTSTVHWRDVCFDIATGKETKRILDHVDGWIKPGTVTALIGPSGAGKTTLLHVLATRTTVSVVSGHVSVDGLPRDASFQRKTGYAQQFDLHMSTDTVRESLQFSALMRQPEGFSREEKLAYVEEVIKLLGMEEYAEAVVGVPGEGLNVEQRKRLTIGVELAARPQLLVFLDEPTSGLDSQTAWSILDLLDTLRRHGQAVLCTIHQPSAPLFSRFDRVLFLGPNGRSVYFGELGPSCSTLTSYFARNGAVPCPPNANPAEWLMETIGCAPGTHSTIDWPSIWLSSTERAAVRSELFSLEKHSPSSIEHRTLTSSEFTEFAASLPSQIHTAFLRVFRHYWRSPSYIYAKLTLTTLQALFIGLSFFGSDNTIQGLQNQTFSIFLLLILVQNLTPQFLPGFVAQRTIYEARERPSKVYSWMVFLTSTMLVEMALTTLTAPVLFVVWYYPIGLQRNAAVNDAVAERGAAAFLFLWAYLVFGNTWGYLVQMALDSAEAAGNAVNGIVTFWMVFCGVLVAPDVMPRFWIWMYHLSPFTYLVGGILSAGLGKAPVVCSEVERLVFDPPAGQTCLGYMETYMTGFGGYLVGDEAQTRACEFCPVSNADAFLRGIRISYDNLWRDFGILCCYIVFNFVASVGVYWLARVPKGSKGKVKEA